MAGRVLCVGALTLDVVFQLDRLPDAPGKYLPRAGSGIAAGMAASAATAAARLGGAVTLWASTGDDAVGRQLVAGIAAEGVDCRHVRRVAGGASAIAACLVDAAGERIIVAHYDPVTQGDPGALPVGDMGDFDAVLCDTRWPGAAARALDGARAAGIPAILDADVAPRAVLDRLLPLATITVASREGAAVALGGGGPAADLARRLAARCGGEVVVTDGGDGSHWCLRATGEVRHFPAPRVEVVDTLAAGDVFHGAFALALAEGAAIPAAIPFASAAAALKCRRFGGRLGAPRRDEVAALLDRGAA